MRVEALQPLTAGINRLRSKGGADPRQLYSLFDGYVDQDGSVRSRPGTVKDYDVPGTKGLCSANGKLVVFASAPTEVPDGVECMVLRHPDNAALTLHKIHFAGPFLGDANGAILYVVAEFNNGDVFHYWLRSADAWAADTSYAPGDMVQPSSPNGFLYRATRIGAPAKTWAPDVARAEGDVVEPTVSNGFEYTVVDVIGDSPRSGATEPDWPAVDGAQVIEDTSGAQSTTPTTPSDPDGTKLPGDIEDRYANRKSLL